MKKSNLIFGIMFVCMVSPLCVFSREASVPTDSSEIIDHDSLSVDQMDFCAAVKDRTPVGVADTFPSDIFSVYCFTRIAGAQDTTAIVHSWYHGKAKVADVQLPVRSPLWRTWSCKRMVPEWRGEWKVEVLGADGSVIATKRFFLE